MSSECSSDETVVYVHHKIKSAVNETEDEDNHSEPDIKNLPKIYSTVNSVSSQDSGINLSFHDSDNRSIDSSELGRSSSTDSGSSGRRLPKRSVLQAANGDLSEDDEIFFAFQPPQLSLAQNKEQDKENRDQAAGWYCPPKNIWKPAVEALQEFNMIRDNDRILVCVTLSGRSSLTLLHTLHQYRFFVGSKGVDFELGAATIDAASEDAQAVADYLKRLDIPYFTDESKKEEAAVAQEEEKDEQGQACDRKGSCTFCDKPTRARLYAIAKKHNYNVLAIGQNLDDFTGEFLGCVFNNGKLKTMKAHYYIKERNLRVIRPFVYVREKALRQFANAKKFPALEGLTARSEKNSRVSLMFIVISKSLTLLVLCDPPASHTYFWKLSKKQL